MTHKKANTKMRILVDFDGNWNEAIERHLPGIEPNTEHWDLHDRYPDNINDIYQIVHAEGFTDSLLPFNDALRVLKLLDKQYEVFICSAIHQDFKYNCNEKLSWVTRFLGPHWVKKIILTADKTVIQGDVLLDDNDDQSRTNLGAYSVWFWDLLRLKTCF